MKTDLHSRYLVRWMEYLSMTKYDRAHLLMFLPSGVEVDTWPECWISVELLFGSKEAFVFAMEENERILQANKIRHLQKKALTWTMIS